MKDMKEMIMLLHNKYVGRFFQMFGRKVHGKKFYPKTEKFSDFFTFVSK